MEKKLLEENKRLKEENQKLWRIIQTLKATNNRLITACVVKDS